MMNYTPKTAAQILKEIEAATASAAARHQPRKRASKQLPRDMRVVPATEAWRDGDWHCVMIPVETPSQRRLLGWQKITLYNHQRDQTLAGLVNMLKQHSQHAVLRHSCTAMHIERLSPGTLDDDNMVALKVVRDYACAWLEYGTRALFMTQQQVKAIGQLDGKWLQTKKKPDNPVAYTVDQSEWHKNRRLLGVIIKLKFARAWTS